MSCDIGVIGMGVMGQNLALNIASHGFTCAVYNRTPEKVSRFIIFLYRLIVLLKEQKKKSVVIM